MSKHVEVLRDVVVKVAQLLAGQSITVTQRGAQAYAQADRTGKPVLVNIPFIPDDASEAFCAAIQGFIDHEIGHVLHTDWKAQNRIRNGHLHSCFNILEDPFVERMMQKQFPGAEYNLDKVGEYFLEKITAPAWRAAKDDREILSILLVPLMRAKAGQVVFDRWNIKNGIYELPVIKDFMDRFGDAEFAKLPKIKSTAENIALARHFYDILNPPPPPPPPPAEEDDEEPAAPAPKLPTAPTPPKAGAPEEDEEPTHSAPAEEPAPTSPIAADEEDESAGTPEDDEEPTSAPKKPEPKSEDPDAGFGEEGAPEDDELDEDEPEDDGLDDDLLDGIGGAPGAGGGHEEDEDDDGMAASAKAAEEDDEEADEKEAVPPSGAKGSSPSERAGEEAPPIDPKDFMEALAEHLTDASTVAAGKAPYLVYTHDDDIIAPFEVPAKEWQDRYLAAIDDRVGKMISTMQKSIERMMASKSKTQLLAGHRSGRMHAPNLFRLRVGDDRVFARKHIAQGKETVVSLLVDNSGSMGGSKMETAMMAAYALSLTLERVGIRHEILGFTTKNALGGEHAKARDVEAKRIGRAFTRTERLWIPIYKAFGEKLGPVTKKRIAFQAAKQQGLQNNVDGECLEVAARRIVKEKADRRVLIVLSDGSPACSTWDSRALEKHLLDTVKRVTGMGVEVFGIGIEDSSVRKFYKNHVVISRVEELPGVVMGKIKSVLSAA